MQKHSGEGARTARLYPFGVLTAGVYLLTLIFYVGGPQSRSRTAKEVFAWLVVLTLLPLFRKGYSHVSRPGDPAAARTVIAFAALFTLLAALVYPFHSTDVFGYINRGWQQAGHGLNPYVYRLADVPGWREDPMFWEHWVYNPNPYGFLFSLLARLLCLLGGGNWTLTLLLFKAANVLAFGLSCWLVWSAAKLTGQPRPLVALYALAWNPLVLMHHIANGHNDILTGCLVALSLYLALRGGGEIWIVPLLVAATLIKYGPVLLIPPALVFIVKRRGWRTAAAGCAIGALVAVLVSVPYLRDWRLFKLEDIRDNAVLIDNSLHSLLIHLYGTLGTLFPPLAGSHDEVNAVIKLTIRLGFLAFLVYQFVTLPKDSSAGRLVEKSVLIMFVLVCVASSKFNAWYVGLLLPSALLLDERHWLRQLVLLISCAELLSLTFFKQAYMLNYFAMILVPAWVVFRRARREGARAADAALEAQPVG